jgi:7-keto-8-aminopelargonate synthetase-like enzyme
MNQLSPALKSLTETLAHARSLGVIQGHFTDYQLNGKTIMLNNMELQHFANCSYLGLDVDSRIKDAAKDAIERYGVQFSCSRTYVESEYYSILEKKLSQIFEKPTIVAPTTSLGHISWIPNITEPQDAIILDHQVHKSVQNAAMISKAKGSHLEFVRHNRMDLLEQRIIELSQKHRKVWYMADGVYSMFGDVAPMEELYYLLEKYEQFYIYIDDAHGMSWAGKNGRGFALNQVPHYHEKMCLITSLNKAYAANGAVMVFSDEIQKVMIKYTGSTLIFSGPVAPAMLSAGIASADIHLSEEIYERQDKLKNLIKHFNKKTQELDLPLVSEDITPIFYIGTGADTKRCLEMARDLQTDGFFVNVSSLPSVPLKNTGIRITLNINQNEDSVTDLLTCLKTRMDERGIVKEEVMKAFSPKALVNI